MIKGLANGVHAVMADLAGLSCSLVVKMENNPSAGDMAFFAGGAGFDVGDVFAGGYFAVMACETAIVDF